jgi:hypothetical protein
VLRRYARHPGTSRAVHRSEIEHWTALNPVPKLANHKACPGHAAYLQQPYYGDGKWKAVYVCTDPQAHGHRDRWASGSSGEKPPRNANRRGRNGAS